MSDKHTYTHPDLELQTGVLNLLVEDVSWPRGPLSDLTFRVLDWKVLVLSPGEHKDSTPQPPGWLMEHKQRRVLAHI